jgi:hypothetical protein
MTTLAPLAPAETPTADLAAGFTGPIKRVRKAVLYHVGLLLVAIAMLPGAPPQRASETAQRRLAAVEVRMRFLIPAAILGLSTSAWAQPSPGAENPLAGPRVTAKKVKPTLVARDFEGKVRRLEVPAEEAALELLELTEEERAACQRVLDARSAILDRIVGSNLELLVQIGNATQAGDRPALVRLAGNVHERLEPLRRRGTLQKELAGVLPEAKGVRLQDLAGEYRTALRDEIVREAKSKGERLRPAQGLARVGLLELGQEIRRSYYRQIAAGTAELESVIGKLGLTPEQEGKVRGMVLTFFQETMGKASPAQKRDLFLRVMATLEPGQKRELLRYISERG